MFTIDIGSDGLSGPFLQWSARGTTDGEIGPKTFYVREGSQKSAYDASKGMVMDIDALKTGWQRTEGIAGVAPEWRWNPSISQMMQAPGDDWKKGFSVKVAIGGGQAAVWEQAGAAAWNCLVALAQGLKERPNPSLLPVVRLASTNHLQFTRGSTIVPVLEIVKWVERPDALKEGVAAGIAIDPAPAPKAAPAPAPVDEDLEF